MNIVRIYDPKISYKCLRLGDKLVIVNADEKNKKYIGDIVEIVEPIGMFSPIQFDKIRDGIYRCKGDDLCENCYSNLYAFDVMNHDNIHIASCHIKLRMFYGGQIVED